jgi:hypothetical protein
MKKTILLIILAVTAITADAQFLFRVSGNGLKEPSYILGTIHTLPSSVKIDSIPEYVEAEAKCRQLYAESDTSATQVIADALTDEKESIFLPEGKTIGDLLTPEQFDLLKTWVKKVLNKNLSPRNNLKPINYLLLFNNAIENEAMKKYYGDNEGFTKIDMDCIDRAVKRGMTLGHLDDYAIVEKMPDRLGFSMDIDAQVDSLVSFLNNYDIIHQQTMDAWKILSELMDYWMKGDYNGFASMEGWDKIVATPSIDIVSRNEKWLPMMKAAMSKAPTMFVVGVGHLVEKEGVIAKLREAGYKVKQVKRKKN